MDTVGRFRSRHANKPGASGLGRVSYGHKEMIFLPDEVADHKKHARVEMQQRLLPKLLTGAREEWTSSTLISPPKQALMRTLSEFQAVKLHYNFRAEVLPDHYTSTMYVDKGNKFRLDRTLLIPKKVQEKILDKNRHPSSSAEMPVHPALETKKRWDSSTEIPWQRSVSASPSARRQDPSSAAAQLGPNKRSMAILAESGAYVDPVTSHSMKHEHQRHHKKQERELAAIRAASNIDRTFTLAEFRSEMESTGKSLPSFDASAHKDPWFHGEPLSSDDDGDDDRR